MRRIIAMLMAIVLLVGNIPVQAFATEAEPQETLACVTEGCTYGAGHTGECSTFVACGKDGCTFAADHDGNCSTYVAPEAPEAEAAADAAVYVTVSNRGQLGMAYEEVTVSDLNQDGKLTVDEALYAAHTVYGKGYASENGTVTKLWDEETSNVSFFLNHKSLSSDVSADTVSDGDYLVASVDQDDANDYDKYSRFDVMEKTVSAGSAFTLTLTDDAGNALAGMEIGLSDGSGNTTMTGLITDVNGAVTLRLDQEGLYCITAKGTVVESSIDVNTMEITSIETPIIAPVCLVTVAGIASRESAMVYTESAVTEASSPVIYAAAASGIATMAEGDTELTVSGGTITLAAGSVVGSVTLTKMDVYTQGDFAAVSIVSAVQNGNTIDIILADTTNPAAALQVGIGCTGGVVNQSGNKCTLNAGQGTMVISLTAYPGYGAPQPTGTATYTINFTIPMGTAYTVTPPTGEGFTFTGRDSVYEGKDYTFTVSVNEDYDGSNMVVMVNGEAVTDDNGTYTVSSVSGDLTITVEGVVKKDQHTVTLTAGEGYTISSDDIPYKGEDYIFTVTPDSVNYKTDTLQVLLDGEPMTEENGVYTIPALAADHVVTVTIDKKAVYSVTKTGMEGVTITGADTVLETDSYTFCVAVDNAYDSTNMVVKVNEEEVTLADGSYTIAAAGENITITVEGVVKKVIHTVTLTEGMGYTISGQETSYAGEPYTFTVTVDDAVYFADQIVVKVDGEPVALTDGKYTFEVLDGDKTVTVDNVVERQLFTVTKPEAEGVTFTGGDDVREGKSYTFSIAVDSAYDSANMAVTVNETAVTLTDGSYTIESASENIVIAVTGVAKKEICSITLPTGKGYSVAGALTAYKGSSYTFTVTVAVGYVGDAMVVTANGEAVTGTNGSYTITVEGDTEIAVTGVEREPLPEKELTVTDNVIDITDKTVYSLVSTIYAKAIDITVSGATVKRAYEDNTTIYILLPSNTADDAQIGVTFGTSLNRCTMSGTTGSLTLSEGEGALRMTLTGKYSSRSGTATYNLIFIREEPSAEPPVCVKTTDTAEIYKNTTLELNLGDYFSDADSYYLVEGENRTPVEDGRFSLTPAETGTLTLKFTAANEAGYCLETLTVTVTVQEVTGGAWIGYTTSNGSLNYAQFYDASGALIENVDASVNGKVISVILPKNYDIAGSVKTVFNLTQNNGVPFLTTSNETAGSATANNRKFTERTLTLSGGAAALTFYYYNAAPTNWRDNNYETWSIAFSIANDLPVLAEGVSAAAEATITAGQNYTLDLSSLFTDVDGDRLTYLVSIDGAAAVAAEAAYSYTTNTAGTYTLVFTANDGKGTSAETYTVTLTVENSTETSSMTVALPDGLEPKFYVSSGFGEDGMDIQGDEVAVTKNETGCTLTYPANAEMLSVRAEKWGGMAFAAEAGGSVTLRQVRMNVVDYDDNAAESTNTVTYDGHTAQAGTEGWLLVTGTEYTYTAVPKDTSLTTASVAEILQPGEDVYTLKAVLGINNPIAITVPTGAKAQLYNYNTNKYYVATELEAKIVKDNGDGTTTYSFVGDTKANGVCYIYRVSMPGKITKAGYLGWGKQTMSVTYTDGDKSNTYRLDDYSAVGQANSDFTEDSVLLNINSRNHLAMNVGETKTLKAYRVWELIKISYQNYIITPDFTYNILSGSDVVSLTDVDSPSVGEEDWKKLEAIGTGTAVIEVTYDAMEVSGGSYDGIYGASDPARTGLVIVQVGGNDTSVNFGIDGFSSRGTSYSDHVAYNENAKRAWDAEFDTLYFTGTSGQLKLSPTASGAITQVAVSHNKGTSWTVLTAEDGVYTAPIVSGNNILRITTEAGVAYQVVRGDKVSVQVTEQDGDGDGKMEPGETVRVALKGLHMPIPKMAGNYNPGFGGNSDGYSSVHLNYTANGQAVHGPGAQYNFVTTANYLDIAIPEDIQTDKLTLTNGYIGVGVLGLTQFDVGGDSHRNIPDSGCNTRDSQTTFHTRSILPEVTVSLEGVKVPVPVTGVSLDKTELTLNVGDTETLTATVAPANADNKNVAWSADPLSVVGVDNGVITARTAGTATVTVTTEDGSFTATCEVTVKQPVESVTITPESAEVEVGKTVELTAQVLPENATDKTVTWTSSDDTVATVENGVVTGVQAGTATITATTADGGKTATCEVTVKQPAKPEVSEGEATIYFSVSHDAEFLKTESGKVMALQKLTVPYFDLALYDLGDLNLPESHADYGKPTMFHLYIYATEVFQYGVPAEEAGKGYLKDYIGSDMFAISGTPGSICLDKFWGYDMNLNYYHNYIYPADESGYGITADRVALKNGDIVTIGHFTSWSFFGDSSSIFNYIAAGSDTVVTTAAQNETPALQIYRAGPNLGGGGSNTTVNAVRDIYYVQADNLTSGDVTSWTKLGTTDATGKLTADLSNLTEGQYILAVAGQYGVDYQKDIVSTPGGIVLNVTESTLGAAVQKVVNQIKAIGEVTLESEETITAARTAYNALTEDQKALVTNADTLTAAEEKLITLKADKAAAEAVVEKIEAIGEVTQESEEAIAAARTAYDALTEDQKKLVTNADTLTAAEATLTTLKADKAAAEAVVEKIDAIGEVTLESEEAIQKAREVYDALTEEQQKLVTNIQILTDAEDKLAVLKADKAAADAVVMKIDAIGAVTLDDEEAIKEARDAYSALTEEQQKLVTNIQILTDAEDKLAVLKADKAAAEAVVEKIEAIGEVTLESEEVIAAAREAYDALTEDQKALVTNGDILAAAETKLADLKAAQEVEEQIKAIGEVTLERKEAIAAARQAYDALTENQKTLVTNADTLTAAEEILSALEAVEADKAEAQTVINLIETIDEKITEDSESDITAAREAYEALTEEQKAYVTNYDDLLAAEEELKYLKLSNADIARIYRTTGDYLAGLEAPGVGSINGEWRVIGLKRSGRAVADDYYEAVVSYVQKNIDANGRLHAAKSSDNSRIILALTALGKDVTDVDGHNLLSGLDEMSYIRNQGINGVIWALIAFDSHGYPTPEGITREELVNAIVNAQLSDGGWALAGKVSDPDMTGMALQALAPYYSTNAQVKTAVDAALTMLSETQNADGTFSGSEGITCESLAQVITGLTALGIDPETDERFVKNTVSALDALAAFCVEEGGFRHGLTTDRNMMATEQGYYALVSYFRLLEKKTSLYDMSDVVLAEKLVKDVEDLIGAIDDEVTKDSKTAIENAREAYEALDDTLKSQVQNLTKLEEAEKAYDQLMAKEVMDKIDAIGEVTLESEQAIQEAEEAYEALTEAQKESVTNYNKLTEAQKAWADLKSTEADKAKAAKVKALIDAIGDVTLDSEAQIREARAAYEALTDVQKPYVDNLETLKSAEAALTDLKNQKAADDVEALIDNIGTVELTTDCENAINAARRGYNSLTTIQKGKVDAAHLKTLANAEADLVALKDQAAADAVKQKIDAIGDLSKINLGSESKIKTARNAYDALTAARKALVSNYQTLVEAEEALNKLKSTVSVTFSLLGCYKHGTGETALHTLAGGNLQTWIAAKTYKVQPGATVKDLLEQALAAANMTPVYDSNQTKNYVEAITRGSETIGEFDNGPYSGWMYTLNGKHPGLGVNQQTLVSGDKVVFHYTDDYRKEEGSTSGSGTTTGSTTGSTGTVSGYTNYITTTTNTVNTESAESVDRLIEDIGEEITLDSEAKILAARAAYDKLTDAQKELVEKYDVLVAAEAELAQLKGEVSEDIYLITGDYLQNLGTPGVGAVGGEWMVIGLARSGRPVPTGYYDHVVNYVRENINDAEQLHSAKSSDNSRLILALTAIGKDVTNVDGHNLLQGLSDMDYIRKQGINGPIWALMAFDSGNYPVPEGDVSRAKLIDVILEAQLSDGGWALSGERSDPDMTGMAIQALAPYMESKPDVKKAVEAAIWTLSKLQNDNGSYSSVDGPNSESIAQVIVALAALGIDADTDARFVKNGISALDALASYYIPGGGFRHILEGNLDGMSTEQAFYALVAYNRMKQDQNFLYDMTDVVDAGGDVMVEETTEPTEIPTEPVEEEEEGGNAVVIWTGVMTVCAAAIALLLLNRKKLFGKL